MPHWSIGSRVAFRFSFVYFGLYCFATQIFVALFPIPKVDIPDPGSLWPMREIVLWVGAHILRLAQPLSYIDTGSGDKAFDWVLALCMVVISATATGIWSILDRKRANYVTLYKWLLLFIRIALAGQMLCYGMSKAIPTQMPFPHLTTLLMPFGNLSLQGVLWTSIGASPAYEVFAGCAELLAGILLLFPRTAMLGALICLADMIQVFMLNMTYDVPVKLLSFHLILLSLFLLVPEFQRLADFFLRNRTVGPSSQPQLFSAPRASRIAFAVQIFICIWLLGMNAWSVWAEWNTYSGGRTKSPLYGIWNVEEFSSDGQLRSPLLTDRERWRRAVFDSPEFLTIQRMDGSFGGYGASIDVNGNTVALTKGGDKNWKANFIFQRVAQDQLILDGNLDSHKVHMRLRLLDRNMFPIVSRRFHWIR